MNQNKCSQWVMIHLLLYSALSRARRVLSAFGWLAAASLFLSPAALAQEQANPLIGFLSSRSPHDSEHLVEAFRRGLGENGFVEHQNLSLEYRWANGQYGQLPELASDLVRRRVAVLVAVGGEPSALAAKSSTATIPIVFTVGGDPVQLGLVDSITRPGGNATGVSLLTSQVERKRLELLHEIAPQSAEIGVLVDPNYQQADAQTKEVHDASEVMHLTIRTYRAGNDADLESAFAAMLQDHVTALLVCADPYFDTRRDRIIAFAGERRLPAIYQFREYAAGGGLMSYGISLTDGYRWVGNYVGRILMGAKPADLPVVRSVKFELVINVKTAKMLGLDVPLSLLARADEVIE